MLPFHLAGTESAGLLAGEPVAQFELGDHRNFVYLILDWNGKKATIVDPQEDLGEPLEALRREGFELSAVLLTHTHFDHVAGVPGLARALPEIPVYVHPIDLHRVRSIRASYRELKDGEIISVGTLQVQVLHTPGHSAGECCYFFERGKKYLFTGDTLFIRDCGRTDFADGSNEQMFASLQRIKSLPPDTIILPGHHYVRECASVLSKEIAESAPLRCRSVEELAALP